MIRQSVRDAFVPYTVPFEAVVTWMYLDIKGYVTTGIGNLINTVETALACPWQRSDGSPASPAEVGAEWHKIKGKPELAKLGAWKAKRYCDLHLTPAGVREIVDRQLAADIAWLAGIFPGLADLPADAQLGLLSLAWARGAGLDKTYPRLTAAVRRGDFATAAAESGIRDNPKRSKAQKQLFANAAWVLSEGLDPDVLIYEVGR